MILAFAVGAVLFYWGGLGLMWLLGKYYRWRLADESRLTKMRGNVVVRAAPKGPRTLTLRCDLTGQDVTLLDRDAVVSSKPSDVRLN